MSWYVICFIVLVVFLVVPSLKRINKKSKKKIKETEIKNEIRNDASDDLFKKIFINNGNIFSSSSPSTSTHQTKVKDFKQEKSENEKKEKRKLNKDTTQVKNESSSNKSEKKELTFAEKRAKGVYSTRCSVRVKGGFLPHHGSIGNLEIYYDGKKMPSLSGSRGKVKIYKSDGNIQVFYKNPSDIQDLEFLGLIVDMYKI